MDGGNRHTPDQTTRLPVSRDPRISRRQELRAQVHASAARISTWYGNRTGKFNGLCTPVGLPIFQNSGLRKGHFADFAEYVKHGAANSSRGHTWVFDSLFHALGLVRESCPINTLPNRELVALDIVPDVARCVLDQALQPTSTLSHLAYLYTFDEFYELYRYAWSKDASLSRDDMLVVLRHLDGRVIHDGPVWRNPGILV